MRLKTTQVKSVRLDLLKANHGTCALCGLPLEPEKAVLDHSHTSGFVRNTIHRGCNSLLGKLENNYKRYGVNLDAFLSGVKEYLRHETDLVHPTHRPKVRKKVR